MSKREKAPFDGERFHNRPDIQVKTLADVFKWKMKAQKTAWPKWLENSLHAKPAAKVSGQELRATFVNHATVLIQTAEFSFVTDPVWSRRVSPFSFVGPQRVRAPGVALEDLPGLDAVLISHNHYDHLDLQTLKRLREKFDPAFYLAKGDGALLRGHGFKKVKEMDWWEVAQQGPAKITFLPAQHWSGRWHNDRNKSLWGSYGVEIPHRKIYFAGDTGYSGHFHEVREFWGIADLALLPIGAYEPRWFMRDAHMNPADAVKAFQDLRARFALGIHFGTFQLTDEGLDEPLLHLREALQIANLGEEKFFTLPEGGAWSLPPTPLP